MGGAWHAVLPTVPAWEPFPLGLVLDWCASDRTTESQVIQGMFLPLHVEIRAWVGEVETLPQNTVPQRIISAYALGQT